MNMTRREFAGGAVAAALSAAPGPEPYPIYRCAGSHRELGRQHGEQAKIRIRAHADYLRQRFKGTREAFHRAALAFVPLFDRHCPHLVEEIRGLGEGAGIPFAEAMATNIRGEITRAPAGGCTTYAVRREGARSGGVLVGQNSDLPGRMMEFAYVLHLKPAGKPAVLMWTFGGMVGYHGMNSAGVAHFANALGGGPAGRFGLPHYPVKRLMLECRRLSDAVAWLERAPLASNGNYMMAGGEGEILNVEATTEGPQLIKDQGKGFLVHTNHYLSAPYAKKENFEKSWQDSFPRLERMNALLAEGMGRLDVQAMQRHLSDHSNGNKSICRHPDEQDDNQTVASIIAEPGIRLHVAAGPPCKGRFVTYSMEN
jgi:isopenicillin-N N-acyltransferase-like protein